MQNFSKSLVVLIVLLNILFTCAILFIFNKTGSEPTTLIAVWFAFTTGELWMLSSIKKCKIREEKKENGKNKLGAEADEP